MITPVIGPDVAAPSQTDLSARDREGRRSRRRRSPAIRSPTRSIVANRGTVAMHNVVVRELFDPNLDVVSSLPAPDLGTDDRWTFPFLPAGASRTISIVTEVKADATPGTIVHNMAQVEDDTGRVARTYEDTLIVEPGGARHVDRRPARPGRPARRARLRHHLPNLSDEDPQRRHRLRRSRSEPGVPVRPARPPDGDLFWNIGDMAADQRRPHLRQLHRRPEIRCCLRRHPDPDAHLGRWTTSGNVASAVEVTLYRTESGPDTPYLLNLTGAPRNLRIGVVDDDGLRHQADQRGRVRRPPTWWSTTPCRPASSSSSPIRRRPTIAGNLLSFTFPTLQPGETQGHRHQGRARTDGGGRDRR